VAGERRSLETYRTKRDPSRTPEPFGPDGEAGEARGAEAPLVFVVQQHAARSLHFDLRLEWGGVLLSWAVPKGPSANPADKQLAVQTEDHPLEYADFEGVIPAGNYGAGAMIVWDRGRLVAKEDFDEGLVKGKLLFELRGYKLRGTWTLVRLKKEPRSWLLIKERDAWARADQAFAPQSVLSGLTVEELAAGPRRAETLRAELERLGAPRRAVDPQKVELQLCEPRGEPFSRPGWLFELKYDGYRLLAAKAGTPPRPAVYLRKGEEATRSFPEIARALAALPAELVVLDGEVVVLDEQGRPVFGRLQKRARLRRGLDVERAALELPATYFAFDLLAFGEFDLRPLPLRERKRLLRDLVPALGPLRYADHVEERGADLYREARRMGLEGVVGKRADSPYRGGRGPAWVKVRADREDDLVVVGFSEPEGTRAGLGALHLASYEPRGDGEHLVYAGRVGTGFSDAQLAELRRRLEPTRRKTPPCEGELPKGREHVWVEPRLVVSVKFSERTEDNLLRQPVFLRERTDKRPEECVRQDVNLSSEPSVEPATEEARGGGGPASRRPNSLKRESRPSAGSPLARGRREAGPPPPRASGPEARREVKLSNLDKVFWPNEGYSKGDLIDYYRAIAPWLLPYLRDRPLVLDRFPDGIDGKSFFQKNAPLGTPEWIRTVGIWSDDTQREIEYFVCNDVETLVHLANLAAIPLHVWASRVGSLDRPDWCILDLDPKAAPFTQVVEVARALHALCEEAGLPSYPKTSGSTGLHVLVPLGGQCSFAQAKQLGEILAKLLVARLPKLATIERSLAQRGKRVYVDYLQNGEGKLIVAPWSARPVAGARVSTTLDWREVTAKLDPTRFTIKTAPARMKKRGADPMAAVLTERPDLGAALARLASLA